MNPLNHVAIIMDGNGFFLICIFTDIGGYIFGKIFKGPKLTKIVQIKLYSGLLGSYLFSFVCLVLLLLYFNEKNNYNYNFFIFF